MPNVQYTIGLMAVVVTLCLTLLLVHTDIPAVRSLCAVGLVYAGLVGAVVAVRQIVATVVTEIVTKAADDAVAQVRDPLGARIGRVEVATARMADTEKKVLTVLTSDPVPPTPPAGDEVRYLN